MTLRPADCQRHRECLSTPAGTTNTLLVVESLRRHIRLEHNLERPNINTDFHRGRHGK
jgi:hypothetical protein